jgi:hypothetical protein
VEHLKLVYFGLTPFTVNNGYILHLRAILFFLALWFFVRVLQMGEIALKMYENLHVMCLIFLSSIIRQ